MRYSLFWFSCTALVACGTPNGSESTNTGGVTIQAFARAHNVGLQRARRAFVALERNGRLVAHGFGARRVYQAP